jgi:phytoene dehydrogenase-like protein
MQGQDQEFDGVVIGGGHNALVLAGYMAKSGLRVAVLEKNASVGGGCATVESSFVPGFLHEVHSQFHRNIPATPWFNDLQLADYGVEYIYPEVNNGMPLHDGRNLIVHADPAVTREALARFNRKDAERYFDVYHKYKEMALKIQIARDYAPPLPPDEERHLLSRSKVGREFLAINERSAYEVAHELFEDETLRAFYLYLFSVRGYLPAPTVKGTGFAIVAMTYLGNKAMLPRGGARSLTHGLAFMFSHHGGRIFLATEAARIILRGGRAVGVETVDGKRFMAGKFVVSSTDPHQTFERFIGRDQLDGSVREALDNYKYGVSGRSFGVLFALHAASREAPHYASSDWDPRINQSFNLCLGYETAQSVITHLNEVVEGVPPEVIGLQAACPTIHDPTRAPAGKHVLLAWQFAPFNLKDGGPEGWEGIKQEYLEKVLARWAEYAPNLAPDRGNIIYAYPQTPPDTERSLINMREGDFHVGALIPSQLGYNRPFPEVSSYRTFVEGLYLTGASTHPSGTITGAPGYNTARVLAEDLGLDLWWRPKDVREVWAELD